MRHLDFVCACSFSPFPSSGSFLLSAWGKRWLCRSQEGESGIVLDPLQIAPYQKHAVLFATSYRVVEKSPFLFTVRRHCIRPDDDDVVEFTVLRSMNGSDNAFRTVSAIGASLVHHCVDVAGNNAMRDVLDAS